jgi:hypothetical protein
MRPNYRTEALSQFQKANVERGANSAGRGPDEIRRSSLFSTFASSRNSSYGPGQGAGGGGQDVGTGLGAIAAGCPFECDLDAVDLAVVACCAG